MKEEMKYGMNEEKWIRNETLLMAYLDKDDTDIGDAEVVIKWNLRRGETDASNRKKYWQNITNTLSTIEGAPSFGGRPPSAPLSVLNNVELITAQVEIDYTALFASHPLYGEMIRKRGRGAGGTYESAEDYGKTQAKGYRAKLLGFYNNHVHGRADKPMWDGTFNDKKGLTIVYPTEEV